MNNTELLSLQEVVWEITGQCNNGCEYCGSKEVWNCKSEPDEIIKIASSIVEAAPKEVSISGGDPLLVDVDIHRIVRDMLKQSVEKVKILTNPKSWASNENVNDILSLYDGVGISINDQQEIDQFNSYSILAIDSHILPITFITNVSTDNIFLLDQIEQIVKNYEGSIWMIQFTMFHDSNNKKAIYNNQIAFDFLDKYINDLLKKYPNRVLLSDNMVNNKCYAGTHVCGITYDGHVVPCLSMRSWANINEVSQGVITDRTTLIQIWETKFNKYRFDSFKCCKDHCNNKCIGRYMSKGESFKELIDKLEHQKTEPIFPGTFVYACPSTIKYPIVTMYMVATLEDILKYDYKLTSTTSSSFDIGDKKKNDN